jgi:hypothetical protein
VNAVSKQTTYEGLTGLILVRFCGEAIASMAATLASAIEWTIESRVKRLLGDFIEKMFGA